MNDELMDVVLDIIFSIGSVVILNFGFKEMTDIMFKAMMIIGGKL